MSSEFLREQLVAILDILRQRWKLLIIPIMVTSLIAFVALKMAPTTFSSTSMILLQAANRAPVAGGVYNVNTMEQVQAVEAWLKSDQVMSDLVPRMVGYKQPESPIAAMVQKRVLAASLSLEVVGNSVLQIKMVSDKPEGLGRNLETVLSRLMEGLTGPEQSIFSAPQFMKMRRNEELANAEAVLVRAIEASGAANPQKVRSDLQRLWVLTRSVKPLSPGLEPGTGLGAGIQNASQSEAAQQLRRSINLPSPVLADLERSYAAYQDAADKLAAVQTQPGAARSNYVSIFSSPEDLLIIGRPQDPLTGESSARKFAIAAVLLSMVFGAGLVVLAEMLGGPLRTRRDFAAVTEIPILARLPHL